MRISCAKMLLATDLIFSKDGDGENEGSVGIREVPYVSLGANKN